MELSVPTLTTPQLTLSPLRQTHSDGMFELWSSAAVCRYSGEAEDKHGERIPLPAQAASDSDRIIAFFEHHEHLGNGCRWAVCDSDSGEFLGAAGINGIGSSVEIAYHLIPRFWGHGFMSEACAAIVEWIWAALEPEVLVAYVEPDNRQSIALLERLGFLLVSARGAPRDGAVQYRLDRRAR